MNPSIASPKRPGRGFERLVHLLETMAAIPGTRVEFDAHLPDRITGSLRQVDVAIWVSSSHGELLYTIECKDLKRPVGVKVLEEELQKARDIGADRVAIASRSGFQRTTVAKAAFEKVDLLLVSEESIEGWPEWMEASSLELKTLRWNATFDAPFDNGDLPASQPLLESSKGRKLAIVDILIAVLGREWERDLGHVAQTEPQLRQLSFNLSGSWTWLNGLPVSTTEVKFDLTFWEEVSQVPLRLYQYSKLASPSEIITGFITDPFTRSGQLTRIALEHLDDGTIRVRQNPAE